MKDTIFLILPRHSENIQYRETIQAAPFVLNLLWMEVGGFAKTKKRETDIKALYRTNASLLLLHYIVPNLLHTTF